jgi:hypothetical protein
MNDRPPWEPAPPAPQPGPAQGPLPVPPQYAQPQYPHPGYAPMPVPPSHPYAPPGYAPAYAPPRKKKTWLIVLLVLGIPVAMIVLAAAAIVGYAALADESPATEQDLQVVLKAADVTPYMVEYTPQPATETGTRIIYPDRSGEIEYEYDDGGQLYLYSIYSFDRSDSDAKNSYSAYQFGAGLGMRSEDITQQEASHLLSWGDQSACYLLIYEGNPIGHRFIARKGKKVVNFTFSGVYFSDPEVFRELMTPVLNRVAARQD